MMSSQEINRKSIINRTCDSTEEKYTVNNDIGLEAMKIKSKRYRWFQEGKVLFQQYVTSTRAQPMGSLCVCSGRNMLNAVLKSEAALAFYK